MGIPEADPHLSRLGLSPDFSREQLQQAWAERTADLQASGASAAEQEALRESYNVLNVRLRRRLPAGETTPPAPAPTAGPIYVAPTYEVHDPAAYDNPWITALGPVVVAFTAVAVTRTPLGFFLDGFHTWTHEFGHATVAWLAGHTASPLPIGWTNTGPKTPFVYFGIIFLLIVLTVAGVRERKVWPVLIAAALLPLQFYLTWMQPEHRYDLWVAFAGGGGELYLSAAAIALFHVRLPEKFKWGWCRYLFVFLRAGVFARAFTMWRDIRRGAIPLPFGSMVNGEEDAGGDLNILQDDFGWRDRQIIATYNSLATACLVAVLAVHLFFALGIDRKLRGLAGRTEPG
jgi:hypothetical protein